MVNRAKLDPTESVRKLMGSRMRILRDEPGRKWTIAVLAAKVYTGAEVLGRIERGEQAMDMEVAMKLDELFEIPRPEIFGFAVLAPLATRESAPRPVQQLATAESVSESLRIYDPTQIPGLVQTPDYTRALVARGAFPKEAEATVTVRQSRQRVLSRKPEPPKVFLVLNEQALRIMIDGPEVMSKQLEHLESLSRHPTVALQILRTRAESKAGLVAGFTLITFRQESPAVFVEGSLGLARDPDTVGRWTDTFEAIRTSAESADTSRQILREIKESM